MDTKQIVSPSSMEVEMDTKRIVSPELSKNLNASLDEHLAKLKGQIADRAYDLASASTDSSATSEGEAVRVDFSSLAKAIDEVTKGQVTPLEHRTRFFDLFPPFTCVCAVLCLAFATLGLLPLVATDPTVAAKVGGQASGFLDIAKIFAGAIVGSTTSIALSSARAKRGR